MKWTVWFCAPMWARELWCRIVGHRMVPGYGGEVCDRCTPEGFE